MEMLTCAACGGNELLDEGKYYVCAFCGTRFVKKSSGSSSVSKSSEIEEMLKRADMYWRHNNKPKARQIYRQILELDASCEIARERS